MRKKKLTCFIACFLVCLAVAGSISGLKANALTMSTITSTSIKEKEKQIANAKDEKKQLQSGLTNLQKVKQNLEQQKSNLKNYIQELDSNLAVIESNIAELLAKIEVKETEIDAMQQDLALAQGKEINQKTAMIRRVRMVYESGDPEMLDMLRQAVSFGDFLNKADYVERVISYDQKVFNDYQTVRKYVELCEEELEVEREILDESKAGLESEQKALEELINEKTAEITKYEADINNQEKAIREYQAEIRAQEEEIKALETLIAQEKKKILAASGVVLSYDGGKFTFPLESYTRVSDDYGDRIHPTLKVKQFHNGIDFASPKGTAIYAAYDGVVVAADYSTTMGNYVMLDHGSGLYTIYMHASSLNVKKDDIVVRGETIAKVGSTGRSTGNHLHFSVRKNGEYQNPWNYITKK